MSRRISCILVVSSFCTPLSGQRKNDTWACACLWPGHGTLRPHGEFRDVAEHLLLGLKSTLSDHNQFGWCVFGYFARIW